MRLFLNKNKGGGGERERRRVCVIMRENVERRYRIVTAWNVLSQTKCPFPLLSSCGIVAHKLLKQNRRPHLKYPRLAKGLQTE
jgi:hypothetical protein